MNVLKWLSNCFSQRGMALRLYNRGRTKAKKRDHQGAIADYTSSIDMRVMPPEVLATVLYHRALTFLAIKDDLKGKDDLKAVLAMGESFLSVNVKTLARQKLANAESQTGNRTTPEVKTKVAPRRERC